VLKELKNHIKLNFPELYKEKVFLAISAGKDSVALFHLLIRIGIKPELPHCNFQLRGKESEEDEKFVKALAKEFDLEVHIKTFEIDRSKSNIQLLARQLRYDWFNDIITVHPTCRILTAHHALDNVETVLLNLSRGTGIKGLMGIPERNKNFIRPLLHFTQDEITSFLEKEQILYRTDSSNFERNYSRNKIRHDVIPVLKEIGDKIEGKFSTTIHEIESANEWINSEVENYMKKNVIQKKGRLYFNLSNLKELHSFFLFRLFDQLQINRKKQNEFSSFLSSKTGSRFYSSEYEFLIDREDLVARKINHFEPKHQFIDSLPFNTAQLNIRAVKNCDLKKQEFDFAIPGDDIIFPLVLRSPSKGEKIKFKNQPQKLISDVLIDAKINRFDKEDVLVLEDSKERVLVLLPIKTCENFAEYPNSETILLITLHT